MVGSVFLEVRSAAVCVIRALEKLLETFLSTGSSDKQETGELMG